jgi:Putative zinc-finger
MTERGNERMDHTEAVRSAAVDRYLLGQLSASETEEFEQHFFDCLECSRELRAGAMFEDNARAVFLEDSLAAEGVPGKTRTSAQPKPSVWGWFWQRPWSAAPALAALVLALVTAYQALVVIPGLRTQLNAALSPQPVASYVLPPISRGDARALEVPAGSRFYSIYMDPVWEGSFAAYMCSVQDESGSTRFSVRLPAPPPGKPIEILMARSLLPSGRYTVIIRNVAESGKAVAELARFALILKLD